MKLRLKFFIICALIATGLSYADIEHVVERGETLESIAKSYGVTPDDILKANPTAKDMFFAGMVINIPVSGERSNAPLDSFTVTTTNVETVSEATQSETINGVQNEANEKVHDMSGGVYHLTDSGEDNLFSKGTNFFGFNIGYFFPKDSKSEAGDAKVYSYGFSMLYSLRAGRYFLDNVFGDINLGLSISSSSTSVRYSYGKPEKSEYTLYSIPLSLHGGYTLPFSNVCGLSLYTGPMFGFPVADSYKIGDEKVETSFKKKVSCDWNFGLEAALTCFIVGGRYSVAMNSQKGNPGTPKGIWMVYIGGKF